LVLENLPNKALHLTAIPLRSIAAGELGRYASNSNILLDNTKEGSNNVDRTKRTNTVYRFRN